MLCASRINVTSSLTLFPHSWSRGVNRGRSYLFFFFSFSFFGDKFLNNHIVTYYRIYVLTGNRYRKSWQLCDVIFYWKKKSTLELSSHENFNIFIYYKGFFYVYLLMIIFSFLTNYFAFSNDVESIWNMIIITQIKQKYKNKISRLFYKFFKILT